MTEKYHVLVEWMSGEGAYKMFQYSVSGDNNIGYADEEEAQKVVDFLNQETAPLHEQIAKLEAENAKLQNELESARRLMQNIMQNLPETDYSRTSAPQLRSTAYSAWVANRMLDNYFKSQESEASNDNAQSE